jgi:hypothetical protein
MKIIFAFLSLSLLATAVGQQQNETRPKGAIHGSVIGPDGKPANGMTLVAGPLGVGLGTRLPRTKSNDAGEYRFANLPWWGRYSVYAEDDDAGYSLFSTGPSRNDPPEVELTPEHRDTELKVFLPPKAGFVQIHLTNRRTGGDISGMGVTVMSRENPESPLFTMSCYSNHVILVPPDKNLLLHVNSDGFREWDESAGGGKPIHLPSGTRLALAVQLEPSD